MGYLTLHTSTNNMIARQLRYEYYIVELIQEHKCTHNGELALWIQWKDFGE